MKSLKRRLMNSSRVMQISSISSHPWSHSTGMELSIISFLFKLQTEAAKNWPISQKIEFLVNSFNNWGFPSKIRRRISGTLFGGYFTFFSFFQAFEWNWSVRRSRSIKFLHFSYNIIKTICCHVWTCSLILSLYRICLILSYFNKKR